MLIDSEDTARFERIDGRLQAAPGPKVEGVLTVLAGPNVGALFTLDVPRLLLGRSGDVHVFLPDPALSRRHACIERRGANYFIQDLDSTNGTFVDGSRIHGAQQLRDGSRIELGEGTTLRFSLHDALEQEAARRTHELMVRDPLTWAFNRRHLEDRLAAEIAYSQRHGSALSVLLVDIDDFKTVNDTYGHDTGDMVLRVLARALTRMTRTEDVVARYGGEEFVILARGIDQAGAAAFAERVRYGVEHLRLPTAHGTLRITVSVGVARAGGRDGLDPASLLRKADHAMYRAKSSGKNRVELASQRTASTSGTVPVDAAEPETIRQARKA